MAAAPGQLSRHAAVVQWIARSDGSAWRFLLRKVLYAIPVLFLVTLGTTGLTDLMPGSPARLILGDFALPSAIAHVNAEYGFNRPLLVRYWTWLGHALHGSLGASIQTGQPVVSIIAQHLPVTLELAILTLTTSVILAVVISVVAGMNPGGIFDRAVTAATSGLISAPTFVTSVVAVYFIAVRARWLPPSGWVPLTASLWSNLDHAILPTLILVGAQLPLFVRVLRGDIVRTLQEDFVLTAKARGLSNRYIMVRHVLRPSSLSLLTIAGLSFGQLIGGSVIVETFFALPGVGYLAAQSIFNKDIPIVQGIVVVVATGYLILNIAVDFCYALIDPRVRRR